MLKKLISTVVLSTALFVGANAEPTVFEDGQALGLLDKKTIKKMVKSGVISKDSYGGYSELSKHITFGWSQLLDQCATLSKEYKPLSSEQKAIVIAFVKSVVKDPTSIQWGGMAKASDSEVCKSTTPYQDMGKIYFTVPKSLLGPEYVDQRNALVWTKQSDAKPLYVVEFNSKNSYGAYAGMSKYWIFEDGTIKEYYY